MRLRAAVVAAALALAGAAARAHDLWIEPTRFAPAPGEVVGLRLQVGEHFVGEPLPRIAALVREFVAEDAAGRRPVAGRDGADPAGLIRVGAPGLTVIGYHSHPSRVELAADKFEAYLAEEGLVAVSALRAQRGQTGTAGRERFVRCAKSLLLTGAAAGAPADRALGLPLELMAEHSPNTVGAGQDWPVRLTHEGRPLAGVLVVAMNRLNPAAKQALRTDADGRVRLRLQPAGVWLVKAVHMIAAPADADTDVDWLSFWASLTFETRAADTGGQ